MTAVVVVVSVIVVGVVVVASDHDDIRSLHYNHQVC